LLKLEGVKEKSADNMLKAIEASKKRPFWRLLFGLNIRYIGEKTAQLITEHFGSMDRLLTASEEEIMAIPGVGPKSAHSLYTWLQQEKNRQLIERLRQAGVNMAIEERPSGPLAGQSFLFTGKLAHLTRSQAEETVRQLGGTVASNVTRSLTHLIVGEDPGSKLEKARRAGVQIHDEQWFLDLLRQHGIDISSPGI
jgi:DNA ligase (NAD+)